MSATFQVDTGRIQAASGDIAAISGEIETLAATMLSRLTALQDAWTGSAATRFQGVVQEWRGTQQTVKASLDSIGVALGQAGTHYADAEAANERMFL